MIIEIDTIEKTIKIKSPITISELIMELNKFGLYESEYAIISDIIQYDRLPCYPCPNPYGAPIITYSEGK